MESVHDIYAAGSTARPLAVGDWVMCKAPEWDGQPHLLAFVPQGICAVDVRAGVRWTDPVRVSNCTAITRREAGKILQSSSYNETWHRLTPAEAVAWIAANLVK